MKTLLSLLSLFAMLGASAQNAPAPAKAPAPSTTPAAAPIPDHPRVKFTTNMGAFTVQLDTKRAPLTVENFLRYVKDGHYSGTIFSRVVEGFIAQGGGYTPDLKEKPARAPIVNESGNGLSNLRGTVAMARTGTPHTATAQFFINLVDNGGLNPLPTRWGYAVFGQVVEGMDVIDSIGHVITGPAGIFDDGVPHKPVIIEKAELL
jgi:peptidyl-prolyl cis-trans isomerase A (cyclophilin A)